MTLERDRGYIYFECDSSRCPEVLETETADFFLAKTLMEEAGWRANLVGKNTWTHTCPDCLEAEYGMAL